MPTHNDETLHDRYTREHLDSIRMLKTESANWPSACRTLTDRRTTTTSARLNRCKLN